MIRVSPRIFASAASKDKPTSSAGIPGTPGNKIHASLPKYLTFGEKGFLFWKGGNNPAPIRVLNNSGTAWISLNERPNRYFALPGKSHTLAIGSGKRLVYVRFGKTSEPTVIETPSGLPSFDNIHSITTASSNNHSASNNSNNGKQARVNVWAGRPPLESPYPAQPRGRSSFRPLEDQFWDATRVHG